MFATGATEKDGRSYHRRLLSEYRSDVTLSNYLDYFGLKDSVNAMKKKLPTATTPTPAAAEGDVASAAAASAAELQAYKEAEQRFFRTFEESFATVKDYLKSADGSVIESLAEVKRMTEEELHSKGAAILCRLYCQLNHLIAFRELNCAGFGKILQKCFDRCALENLDLQRKLRQADHVIFHSSVRMPPFDINKAIDYLTCLHSIAFKKTFEASLQELKLAAARDLAATERIVPMPRAYFYQKTIPCKDRHKGGFAVRLLPGTSNPTLAKHIGYTMCLEMTKCKLGCFANGEVSVKIDEPVRGDDCFVVQSIAAGKATSMSTSLMELLLVIQTMKLASASRVTAVVPYMAYTHRTIEAAAVAEFFDLMGCDRVITVDMYKEQVEGFFHNIPVENISAKWEFVKYLTQRLHTIGHDFTNIVVVSPDSETVGRARAFADSFHHYAKLDGEKQFVGLVPAIKRIGKEEVDTIGSVKGKTCIIVDNVIEEGINIDVVARKLHADGAVSIRAVATHAIFSGEAVARLTRSPIDEIIVTDSINQDDALRNPAFAAKLRVLPVAPLLAGAIHRIHSENSVSTLLEK